MKFGVNILNFGPGATPDAMLRWALAAETLGYDSIWISDHVAVTTNVRQRYPEPFFDPFTALTWLAGKTQRIQVGTTVCVLPYRHPLLMSRLVANLDHLSNGRFVFGVGVGSSADEFTALGLPFELRGGIGNESLRIMRAVWTATEPVSHKGRFYAFEDVSPMRPLQSPHPPVWVGGASESALRRAARYGDAWHPILRSPAPPEENLAHLRRFAEEAGRPPPRFCPRIRLDLHDEPVTGERLPGAGSLGQVRDDLRRLRDLGAEHVVLDWYTFDLEATRNHARGLRMLAEMADRVLDLEHGAIR